MANLVITENNNPLALVSYKQDFGDGIQALEYGNDESNFDAGFYIKYIPTNISP